VQFKDGVDTTGVSRVLWYYLPQVDRFHYVFTGEDLVVTSMRRTWGSIVHNPSPGDEVLAADLRRWYLDELRAGLADSFCTVLNIRFGHALRVVLEPEWLTPAQIAERGGVEAIDPHIHIQVESEVLEPIWL